MSVKEILQAQGCLYPDTIFAPQGWVCPKCGRVYSPFTPMCLYCGDEGNVTVTTDTKTAVEAFERASEVDVGRGIPNAKGGRGMKCDEVGE